MALGLPFASSFGRPARRISPRQGRKENAEPINRCRASEPIYTAMDTKLSPASQTRASTATCLRGLIDNTKDRSGKEPKERAGLSNDGECIQPYTGPLTDTTSHTACGIRRLLPQDHSRK